MICWTMMLADYGESDKKLVTEIYENNKRMLYGTAFSILKNDADAEDAVQTVMLNVIKNLDSFRNCDEKATVSQLYTYVRNASINIYNKNKRKSQYESTIESEDKLAGDNTEDKVLDASLASNIVNAVNSLPEIYRDVIMLVCIHGYSQEKAAEILEISNSALRKRLFTARKKLSVVLGLEV